MRTEEIDILNQELAEIENDIKANNLDWGTLQSLATRVWRVRGQLMKHCITVVDTLLVEQLLKSVKYIGDQRRDKNSLYYQVGNFNTLLVTYRRCNIFEQNNIKLKADIINSELMIGISMTQFRKLVSILITAQRALIH